MSSESSWRCSGVIDSSIRCIAAAWRARLSSSCSTVSGLSGKNWPCLSMNSAKSASVSSPRACFSSSALRSAIMSLSACRDSAVGGILQRLLHAAELLVEHLALQHAP